MDDKASVASAIATTGWESMRTQELVLGDGIPSTLITGTCDAPLVLFSNGYSAHRSQAIPPGVPENPISPPLVTGLLEAGYNLLVPENPGHGDRLGAGERTSDRLVQSFLGEGPDLIQLTADETSSLIDDAVERGLVSSPSRVGVFGHSWGGFQSVLRLLGDERIACGVALIPVIDPRCLDPFAALPRGIRLDDRSLVERAILRLQSRPLLLVASSDDDVAPPEFVRDFVRTVRADKTAGDGIDYLEFDGVGHHYDPRQLAAILPWLQSHLPTSRRFSA